LKLKLHPFTVHDVSDVPKKKSMGVRSEFCGGQLIGHPLLIHQPGKHLSRTVCKTASKCEDEVHGLIFQQDGAPAYFGAILLNALYEQFHGQWISGGGPINLPPWRGDLTPMDIFF
jgi:hypothetical protein